MPFAIYWLRVQTILTDDAFLAQVTGPVNLDVSRNALSSLVLLQVQSGTKHMDGDALE